MLSFSEKLWYNNRQYKGGCSVYPRETWELRRCYGRACMALLVYTLLVQLCAGLAAGAAYAQGEGWFSDPVGMELLNTALVYPLGLLVFRWMLRDAPVPKLAKPPLPTLRQAGETAVVALGLLYGGSMLTHLLLSGTDTTDYANQFVEEQPLWAALVFTVVLAPVFEELIFRKVLLDRLLYLGDWSALLLSSLFFGLFHTNLYQFLYALLVGLVLGYIRIMTGRMVCNIALHMGINLLGGVLVGRIPEGTWGEQLLGTVILVCIAYSLWYLASRRPWEALYEGPMDWFSPMDKAHACLSSPAFWLCVAVHLGLSFLLISL